MTTLSLWMFLPLLGLYDICFTRDVWWSIKACVYSSMEATFSARVLWHFLCYNRPNHVVGRGCTSHYSKGTLMNLSWADIQRDWKSPPNIVSYLRLALVIPVCWLVLTPGLTGWIGFCLFVVAVATDKLDGWLAKRNDGRWITKLGKVIDSYADKILIGSTLIAVIARTTDSRLSVVVATAVIAVREVVVVYVKTRQPVKSAAEAGRFSMVAQSIAVALLVLPPVFNEQGGVAMAVLWLAVGASLCSGWVYVAEWRHNKVV